MSSGVDGVTLVIPAWREGPRLEATIRAYFPALMSLSSSVEILVVADGADTHTLEAARAIPDGRIRVLEYPERLGKGRAVIEGFRAAHYERVGFVDADAPISPDDLSKLILLLAEADCVIGSRRLTSSKLHGIAPPIRMIASWLWNLCVRGVMGLRIRDTQFGAKFFKRSVLRNALPAVGVSDWAFDVSLLYHVQRARGTILEVPVEWRHDQNGHFSVGRHGPLMVVSLFGVRLVNSPLHRLIPGRAIAGFSRAFSPTSGDSAHVAGRHELHESVGAWRTHSYPGPATEAVDVGRPGFELDSTR
jgi:glycosyltransferase involved in cell wall biosynthesis